MYIHQWITGYQIAVQENLSADGMNEFIECIDSCKTIPVPLKLMRFVLANSLIKILEENQKENCE